MGPPASDGFLGGWLASEEGRRLGAEIRSDHPCLPVGGPGITIDPHNTPRFQQQAAKLPELGQSPRRAEFATG